MNPDNTFRGAYLKVHRAYHHIQQIIDHSHPLASNLFELKWIRAVGLPCGRSYAKITSDPDSKVMELAFFPKYPIPETFAFMIGDAVHNLRAALDYSATAIVRAAQGDTKFVTFPFHEERKDLVAAQSKGIRAIQAALPNTDVEAFFRDTIKPYNGGNTPLWILTKMDKIDKHNFILPTVTIGNLFQSLMTHSSPTVNVLSINSTVRNDASRPFAFIRLDASNGLPEQDNIEVTADISFPQGEFFGGAQVVPTLTNVAQIVEQTLECFERFAIDAGLYSAPVQ